MPQPGPAERLPPATTPVAASILPRPRSCFNLSQSTGPRLSRRSPAPKPLHQRREQTSGATSASSLQSPFPSSTRPSPVWEQTRSRRLWVDPARRLRQPSPAPAHRHNNHSSRPPVEPRSLAAAPRPAASRRQRRHPRTFRRCRSRSSFLPAYHRDDVIPDYQTLLTISGDIALSGQITSRTRPLGCSVGTSLSGSVWSGRRHNP